MQRWVAVCRTRNVEGLWGSHARLSTSEESLKRATASVGWRDGEGGGKHKPVRHRQQESYAMHSLPWMHQIQQLSCQRMH